MDTRIALGVNNAPINALGSFAQGEGQAAGVEASHLQHAKDTIEMVGAGAMHALNGDPNGEVDPVKYGEVMDSFEQMGVDVSKFRDNPNFAKVAAHASMGALNEISQANNERDYKLIVDKWQKDLEQQGVENARADKSLAIQQQNSDSLAASRASSGADDPFAQKIGDAIIAGKQSPSLMRMGKHSAAIASYLADQGYDQEAATNEEYAAKRYLSAMNSTQQTKLRQNIATLDHSLDLVQSLAEQWDAGGYQDINAARRTLAEGGVLTPEENSIIHQLDAEIKDVNAELASVYMGGNSPTEQALQLASHSLNADWSLATISDMVKMAKINIGYRVNAMNSAKPGGVGADGGRYNPNDAGGGDAGDDSDVTIEEMP